MNKSATSFLHSPITPEVLEVVEYSDLFKEVERLVEAGNDYVTSILECCAKRGLDTEVLAAQIKNIKYKKKFKQALHADAKRLHMLKR
jgi:hypothetical protein